MAQAAPAESEHVKVKLLAEKAMVAPGDKVTLAIVQDIVPHWHVYWSNPGDSGMTPSVTWTLPDGYTSNAIQWPAPSRIEYGPLVNFGYSNHVTFLVDINVPKTATVGSQANFQLAFNYLVCSEICVPENARLDVTVPVAEMSKPVLANAAVFASARSNQPHSALFTTKVSADADTIILTVDGQKAGDAFFFPDKAGLIDNAAPQELSADGNGFTLTMKRGDLRDQPLDQVSGILNVTPPHDKTPLPYAIMATETTVDASAGKGAAAPHLSRIAAFVLAFFGGIILNLMPCVFPILSLKVLSLSHHVHSDRQTITSGLAYMGGILVAFALVALSLLSLRSAGHAVGWGFQLQSPIFVLALIYVLFAMGLSLSGLFEISPSFLGFGSQWAAHHGNVGSFFTGLLAALVATPCTAPFMGAALGFAVTQPGPVAFGIIEMLGIGLALPYLFATIYPQLFKFMPRPGIWMQHIKQVLAFPLYGSAVWLIWVLSLQSGSNAVLIALAGALLIAFAAWVYSSSRDAGGRWRLALTIISALAVLAALSTLRSPLILPAANQKDTSSNDFIPLGWENFDEARLTDLQHQGKPVFIDMSAAWCITCILNERVALGPETVSEMKQRGITLLKGDWTNQDPAITRLLARFGRNGVPLYIYFPGGDKDPVVLPQILTPAIVTGAIDHA